MTLDDWTAFAKASVAKVGSTLAPDGDWMPTVLAQTVDGGGVFVGLVSVPPSEYPEALRQIGVANQLRLIALIASSWVTKAKGRSLDEIRALREAGWSVSQDPDRREVLMLAVASAEREVWWMAPILRSKTQVALGEWEETPMVSGHQPGSLLAAIRQGGH